MPQSTGVIPQLTPTALHLAGVKLEDSLWLHVRRGSMSFTEALTTERGQRVLEQLRAFCGP